jgi:hypothetical protein
MSAEIIQLGNPHQPPRKSRQQKLPRRDLTTEVDRVREHDLCQLKVLKDCKTMAEHALEDAQKRLAYLSATVKDLERKIAVKVRVIPCSVAGKNYEVIFHDRRADAIHRLDQRTRKDRIDTLRRCIWRHGELSSTANELVQQILRSAQLN